MLRGYWARNLLFFSTALLFYSTQRIYMNALFPPLFPPGADKKLNDFFFFFFYFSSQDLCCFQQSRLYMLTQKASSAFRHWAVTLVWSCTVCLVSRDPSSSLNNRLKKHWFVATPQKWAIGILNSAAGFYCLVLIYLRSPGSKRTCGSTHPSCARRQAGASDLPTSR